jgi:hypothetical protein
MFVLKNHLIHKMNMRGRHTRAKNESTDFDSKICVLCGLVVRVPGYRSRGPASFSGATRFSEK